MPMTDEQTIQLLESCGISQNGRPFGKFVVVHGQMAALELAISQLDVVPSDTKERFLWETMLELWAIHGLRDSGLICYDVFLKWFPEFDDERLVQ